MAVAGEDNVVADTMSRHPNSNPDDESTQDVPIGKQMSYCMSSVPTLDEDEDYEISYPTSSPQKI